MLTTHISGQSLDCDQFHERVLLKGALYEIGSALSFFQLRNYADEFRASIEGTSISLTPLIENETVAAVTEDIEENSRDFVWKRLARDLKGHPFAEFIAHLLGAMGYRTRLSPEGPDGGVDIVAHKAELGLSHRLSKYKLRASKEVLAIRLFHSCTARLVEMSTDFW